MKRLELHDDRALPLDLAARAVGCEIYAATRSLPRVCLHGHVDDERLLDPAAMFITGRLLPHAGFVDDARALASIPARHDVARGIDAGFLPELVPGHLLDLDEATETAVDLAYAIPKRREPQA